MYCPVIAHKHTVFTAGANMGKAHGRRACVKHAALVPADAGPCAVLEKVVSRLVYETVLYFRNYYLHNYDHAFR